MEFSHLLALVGDEPVFETGLLLAGQVDPNAVRQQLTRWTAAKRIYQLRRGVYALAPPYRHVKPHPFVLANALVRGSYVSLQSALAFWDWIPEYVPVTTSVTSARPARWDTPLGSFEFRHIKPALLYGYHRVETSPGQFAFVAAPEKALLDLIHLTPQGSSPAFLEELRLQQLDQLDVAELKRLVEKSERPKWRRAARWLVESAARERDAYVEL